MGRIRITRATIDDLAIVLSVAAVLTFAYVFWIHLTELDPRFMLHNQIVTGEAPSPYQYRVLAPFLAEATIGLLGNLGMGREAGFIVTFIVLDFLALSFSLYALLLFAKRWFSREQALVGMLFVAATMPIALREHYYQPWSLWEPGFFSLGLLLSAQKRYWGLGLTVALATLNRETAVFIPPLFALTQIDLIATLKRQSLWPKREMIAFGCYLAIWLAIFAGVRLLFGPAEPIHSPAELLSKNLSLTGIANLLVNVPFFLGFFWVFAIYGIKQAPPFIRKAAWIVPLYLVPLIFYAVWSEIRLLMPLYPVLIALALSHLFGKEEKPQQEEA